MHPIWQLDTDTDKRDLLCTLIRRQLNKNKQINPNSNRGKRTVSNISCVYQYVDRLNRIKHFCRLKYIEIKENLRLLQNSLNDKLKVTEDHGGKVFEFGKSHEHVTL